MNQPMSIKEQLTKLRSVQALAKKARGHVNRELNRILRIANTPRADKPGQWVGQKYLTHEAVKRVIRVAAKLSEIQRFICMNRQAIHNLEIEMSRIETAKRQKMTYPTWMAILYDQAHAQGLDQLLDADPEAYRKDFEAGKRVSDVLESEKTLFDNLTIN